MTTKRRQHLEARLDRAMAAADKPLAAHQIAALRLLSTDASAWVPSGTLGLLRARGYVGKVVGRDNSGSQKTTSPITATGRAALAAAAATSDGRGARDDGDDGGDRKDDAT